MEGPRGAAARRTTEQAKRGSGDLPMLLGVAHPGSARRRRSDALSGGLVSGVGLRSPDMETPDSEAGDSCHSSLYGDNPAKMQDTAEAAKPEDTPEAAPSPPGRGGQVVVSQGDVLQLLQALQEQGVQLGGDASQVVARLAAAARAPPQNHIQWHDLESSQDRRASTESKPRRPSGGARSSLRGGAGFVFGRPRLDRKGSMGASTATRPSLGGGKANPFAKLHNAVHDILREQAALRVATQSEVRHGRARDLVGQLRAQVADLEDQIEKQKLDHGVEVEQYKHTVDVLQKKIVHINVSNMLKGITVGLSPEQKADGKLKELMKKVTDLQIQVEKGKTLSDRLEGKIKQLETENAALRKHTHKLSTERDAALGSGAKAGGDSRQLQLELTEAKQNLAEAEQRAAAAEARSELLESTLGAKQDEARALTRDAARLQSQHSAAMRSLEDKLDAAREDKMAAEAKAAKLERDAMLSASPRGKGKKGRRKESQAEEADPEVEHLHATIRELREEVQQLDDQLRRQASGLPAADGDDAPGGEGACGTEGRQLQLLMSSFAARAEMLFTTCRLPGLSRVDGGASVEDRLQTISGNVEALCEHVRATARASDSSSSSGSATGDGEAGDGEAGPDEGDSGGADPFSPTAHRGKGPPARSELLGADPGGAKRRLLRRATELHEEEQALGELGRAADDIRKAALDARVDDSAVAALMKRMLDWQQKCAEAWAHRKEAIQDEQRRNLEQVMHLSSDTDPSPAPPWAAALPREQPKVQLAAPGQLHRGPTVPAGQPPSAPPQRQQSQYVAPHPGPRQHTHASRPQGSPDEFGEAAVTPGTVLGQRCTERCPHCGGNIRGGAPPRPLSEHGKQGSAVALSAAGSAPSRAETPPPLLPPSPCGAPAAPSSPKGSPKPEGSQRRRKRLRVQCAAPPAAARVCADAEDVRAAAGLDWVGHAQGRELMPDPPPQGIAVDSGVPRRPPPAQRQEALPQLRMAPRTLGLPCGAATGGPPLTTVSLLRPVATAAHGGRAKTADHGAHADGGLAAGYATGYSPPGAQPEQPNEQQEAAAAGHYAPFYQSGNFTGTYPPAHRGPQQGRGLLPACPHGDVAPGRCPNCLAAVQRQHARQLRRAIEQGLLQKEAPQTYSPRQLQSAVAADRRSEAAVHRAAHPVTQQEVDALLAVTLGEHPLAAACPLGMGQGVAKGQPPDLALRPLPCLVHSAARTLCGD